MIVRCDLATFYSIEIGEEVEHPETGQPLYVQAHQVGEIEDDLGIKACGFFLKVSMLMPSR